MASIRNAEEFEHLWGGRPRGQSDGLPIGVFGRRSTRAQVASVVRRAPQVMVKITGGGRGMGAIRESMDYVSKDGEREIETDDGAVLRGAADLRALKKQWKYGLPERSHRREAFNVIMSMPKGTEAAIVKAAAREVARQEFKGHQYMMVLHEHQRNPHVHVLVRAEGDNGRRLNPRKADLHRWRERFAAELRACGIDAAATRQAARGEIKAPRQIWQIYADQAGRWAVPRAELKTDPSTLKTRADALKTWDDIIAGLRASKDSEDRQLATDAAAFVRNMPVTRLLANWRGDSAGQEIERPERGLER